MNLLDIYFVTSLLLVWEIVKYKKYLYASPLQMFLASFYFVYIIPWWMVQVCPDIAWMSRTSLVQSLELMFALRLSFYSFVLSFIVIQCFKLSPKIVSINAKLKYRNVVVVFYIHLFLFVVYLGVGVDFDPKGMIDRFLYPREYTYIKEATGPINYLLNAIRVPLLVLLLYGVFTVHIRKYIPYLLVLLATITISGSKSALLFCFLLFFMLLQKSKILEKKTLLNKIYGNAKILFILAILLVASFSYYTVRALRTYNAIDTLQSIVDYQREAYYTAQILDDFKWKPEYTIQGLSDTLLALVPRELWNDKPYIGYYNRHWRELYEPRTVIYHSSTYGMISESYLFLGYPGVVLYSVLLAWLCSSCYRSFVSGSSLFSIYCSIFIAIYFYYFVRSGILFFMPWFLAIQLIVSFSILRWASLPLQMRGTSSSSCHL